MYDKIVVDWMQELLAALATATNAHAACDAAAAPVEDHIAVDRALQSAVKQLENSLSPTVYANSQIIRDNLKQIRSTIYSRLSQAGASLQLPGEPITPLSLIISQLTEPQARRVMNALFINDAGARAAAFNNIFDPNDVTKPAVDWRNYFDPQHPQGGHTLEGRFGSNNVSLKIGSLRDPPEVLKVEHRLGSSRHMDDIVRAELPPDLVTPIAAPRLLLSPGDPTKSIPNTARTLMVTSFCEYGGAQDYAKKLRDEALLRPPEDTTFLSETLEIAKQMCAAFQAMEHTNLYFPDAKLANWLVDAPTVANGPPKLRIADTKSFLRAKPDALAELKGEPDNAGARMTSTPGYCSTEVKTTFPKFIHAGIFGRNLYKFLTGKTPTAAELLNCDAPVFKIKPCGKLFAQLIEELTADPLDTRLTVDQATTHLRLIEITLDPRYQSLEDKKRELKTLLGTSVTYFFQDNLTQLCKAQGFSLDNSFISANNSIDATLTLVRSTRDRYVAINTPPITFKGKELFPESLFMEDLLICIEDATDFDTLAQGITDHNDKLQSIETKIASLRELEELRSKCKALGFGNSDSEMEEFLKTAKYDALQGTDLSSRFDDVMKIHERLTEMSVEADDSLIKVIRALIEDLPNKQGIEALSIKALLDAAIEVPVELRADLLSNHDNPYVSALNNALKMVKVTDDPDFKAIIENLEVLNTLTDLDNSSRLFESLVSASENLVDSKDIIRRLSALVEDAIAAVQNAEQLQRAIADMPTVFLQCMPALPEQAFPGG